MCEKTNSVLYSLTKQVKVKNIKLPTVLRGRTPKIQDMREDIKLGAINEKSESSLRSKIKPS
jgi:hypothetical protein